MSSAEYTGDVLTEEEAEASVGEETTVEEETEMLEEGDIIVETQEPEAEEDEETVVTPAPSTWSRLLRSFFGFFRP